MEIELDKFIPQKQVTKFLKKLSNKTFKVEKKEKDQETTIAWR